MRIHYDFTFCPKCNWESPLFQRAANCPTCGHEDMHLWVMADMNGRDQAPV